MVSNSFIFLKLSRRAVLKLLGIALPAAILGYSRFSKPQPFIYQQDSLSLPSRPTKPKSVVIIGAGLAGLACAYELSQRGFQVTLLERAPNLGGKIASWTVQVGSETFKMEHGFHGFFPQYYNLNSIAQELSITNNFQSLKFYSVVFKDNIYRPENFYPSHSTFPWNIIDLWFWSSNRLQWGINLLKPSHWKVFKAITGVQIPKIFTKFDNISVTEWVKQGFPKGIHDLYFLPFAKATLNAPDILSAGELLQFFHFYFFGNPEGLAFSGTKDDMGTSLVQPFIKAIQKNGGQVISEGIINKIICNNEKIISLTYQQGNSQTEVPFWVERNNYLTNSHVTYYGAGDRVFIATSNHQEAISLTCTHQGCTVSRQTDGTFLCPCHGTLYDDKGKVFGGPAKQNLPRYKINQQRETSILLISVSTLSSKKDTMLEADYYVMATDVPGIKQLWELIEGDINPKVTQQVVTLTTADPFAVGRFWFDQDFDWNYSDFTSVSGYKLTDSITLYHHIQNQFIEWSKHTGGSVIELHAYCYKEKDFPNQESLLRAFEQELYEIVPKLKQANCLNKELVNQNNFSGYPPNSYNNRPKTTTEIKNLYFAGDWVKMPFPCSLMERAVSSGLLAANEILHQEGLQRRTLLTVAPSGLVKI
ncbi:FAD-dependent oxidoreductase [cyanobacterium endosymbiont of Epithemia turgida]|uniref:FAD-dependent oxidoreductase n=1 Tax=cyanobacterium endosymbiont of Epithemia turgida TaxID=718217 RepID=UPI0004D16AB5|nr:FAD-dependent oxidoreductase [cyanobacterium endosymbiont of Epithemia turgida]BAP18136.1 putative amine oxidase [cyanobacterium endosymbiont of Epithemia turgida isolate EtSB Lake Yunoko]